MTDETGYTFPLMRESVTGRGRFLTGAAQIAPAANTMEHLALFEPDLEAGGFVVTFPDFSYGVTQGESEQEA